MDRSDLPLRVDVLGPLVLHVDGRAVDVPGARAAGAAGPARPGRATGVSAERLIDALWPDDPPDNASSALQSHVSRLRAHLGDRRPDDWNAGAVRYRLRLEPFELDADAARRLAATDPAAAWRSGRDRR